MDTEQPIQPPSPEIATLPSQLTSAVALVLLAAGDSTRMGQPKQLLLLAGQPLVLRSVDAALGADIWPVVVVLGCEAAAVRRAVARRPVLCVENAAWTEGMASSLRTGVEVAEKFSSRIEAIIVALADQPALSASALNRLVQTWRDTHCSAVAARYAGGFGAPALFARTHCPSLEHLTGDQGARRLLATLPPAGVAAVDLPELAADLDTPADYAAWRARLGG